MAALSLRGTGDSAQVERALEVRTIAEYFISEVVEQQPPEVAQFMLDTSALGTLTADACAAVTGRQDAAAMLRGIGASHLFLVGLDDERTSFRYHHLVRQVLFRNKIANLGLGTQVIQWLILQGSFFVVSVYLQEVYGYDAIKTGLILTPATIGILVASAGAERFARRHRNAG